MTLLIEEQEELVRETMRLAKDAAQCGDLPFAALLIDKSGNIIIAGKNTVNSTNNAAAHAEINILFEAGTKLRTNDLSDYALVSNAASCPMCMTAMIKAKVTKFYYGAPNEGTMIPNITMEEIIQVTPFEVDVYSGILKEKAMEQIRKLSKR